MIKNNFINFMVNCNEEKKFCPDKPYNINFSNHHPFGYFF